jgi:hypothetical protein
MSSKHLSRARKLVFLVSALLGAFAMFAQPAATQGPAAPYIVEPGVNEVFHNGKGVFTARIFCGPWQGVVQFTAGTAGKRFYTRTVYVCENTEYANVRFTVRPGQLGPNGNYQYRLKVGRHDSDGYVTRWTHSLVGTFSVS